MGKNEMEKRMMTSDLGDGGDCVSVVISIQNGMDLAPAVRQAFENGHPEALLQQLRTIVKKNEVEIEDLCKSHYEEFIRAVDELRRVLVDTDDLKAELSIGNQRLQEIGRASLSKIEQLLESNLIRNNVADAMKMTKKCIQVLELCQRCNTYVSDRRFYHALKMISFIEEKFLKIIPVRKLNQLIEREIPLIKLHIEKKVCNEFNEWLAQIRSSAKSIGFSAIARGRKEIEFSRRFDEEEDDEAALNFDMSTLHRAYHIHTCLGIKEKFRDYYYRNRLLQLNSDIQISSGQPFMDHYKILFAQVAGYFVVEDRVLRTSGGVLLSDQVETMWENAIVKLMSLMEEQFCRSVTAGELLAVKDYADLFGTTMSKYEYRVSLLHECIIKGREKYHRLLLDDCRRTIGDAVAVDTYEQMVLKEREYTVNVLPFHLDTSLPPFPYIAPFSSMVPEVCRIVGDFIKQSSNYMSYSGDMEFYSDVKKYLERLLIDVLNEVILDKLHSGSTGVPHTMQIAANISFLERACDFFLRIAAEKSGISDRSAARFCAIFTPRVVLKTSRDVAYIALLDTLISTGQQILPSDALYKVISGALEHISNCIVGAFIGESVKRFNVNALIGINIDLKLLESFADEKFCSSGLSNIYRDASLREYLIEARQMLNLLLSSQPENFMNPVIRERNYYSLDYKKIACVCDKFKDSSDGIFGGLSNRNSKQTSRKKSIDLLKKRLRDFN